MDCYVCARAGRKETAVAICRHCNVALCMTHLAELQGVNQGGMSWTCDHKMPTQGHPRSQSKASPSKSVTSESL